ncbi:MAG: N5-glutamine methyltransferase family protein [Gemmatimonadota bacterium]
MSEAAGGTAGRGIAPPPAPTRREAVLGLAEELGSAGVESARLEAERLVCHALGIDRAELALTGAERLTPEEAGRLARAVGRRLSGEPLQHIEGTVAFRQLVLAADRRALIPRPETEQLVDLVAAWGARRSRQRAGGGESAVRVVRRPMTDPAGGFREADPSSGRRKRALVGCALDIGTGSGAIALSLAVEGIAARVVATDVSGEALEQAAENRARLPPEVAERVELRRSAGPVWEPVRPGERFDLIVSNPPYVTDRELEELPPDVGDHEPREALAGGPDGLEVLREIVAEAARHLKPGGALFLEIGPAQGEAVRRLLEATGRWRRVEVEPDLTGRDRFVRAEPAF